MRSTSGEVRIGDADPPKRNAMQSSPCARTQLGSKTIAYSSYGGGPRCCARHATLPGVGVSQHIRRSVAAHRIDIRPFHGLFSVTHTLPAREAASQMLTAYDPQTQDELHLAANIIGFSFQALEALSQAAAPGMPLTRTLRLRGGAVSLSRESHKAQRRLDKLQAARRAGIRAETQPEPTQPDPKIEKALDLIDTTRKIAAAAKTEGLTWTQAYEQRQRDNRLAASRKRAEARIVAQANVAAASTMANHPGIGQAV
jgi:hypothetical protein